MLTTKTTPHLRKLIQRGRRDIKNQFLPSELEKDIAKEELEDPIGDDKFTACKGLVHRYPNRVLLICTLKCAAHCRFCFRRNRVGNSYAQLSDYEIKTCLNYIKQHKEVTEVILSGGDPLVCDLAYLERISKDIASIKHVKLFRIHTRVPVVAPEVITEKLLSVLQKSKKTIWCVLHINSKAEITPQFKKALELMKKSGIYFVSQSVLLKGINDSVQRLNALFTELLVLGVKPYYLHYPDLAQGTSHFRIPLTEALSLYVNLKRVSSGMSIPQFIVDLPGGGGKVSIGSASPVNVSANDWEFKSPLTGEKVLIKYPKPPI